MSGLAAEGFHPAALERLFAPIADRPAVGLAVSGGPDSLALMVLAARWRGQRSAGPKLVVYSLDHGLRPEAADEVGMVMAAAHGLGLEARALKWQGHKPGAGVQSAARAARYRLIGQAMARDGAPVLMTAHHARDQAETVLMRLAHGSGLDGLSGMQAFDTVLGVEIFRPLLGIAPERLAAVVPEAGLVAVDDPSNRDTHYERVRWRAALPGLAALGLDTDRIATFARRAGDASVALELWADKAWSDLVVPHPLGALRIDRVGFSALPRAVATRLLARVVVRAGGGGRPYALAPLERAVEALMTGSDRGFTLLGAQLRLREREIWICREAGRLTLGPILLGPESTIVWDARFEIRNLSQDAAFEVAPAQTMTRAAAEAVLGTRLVVPIAAIHAAPLIVTQNGGIAALGENCTDRRLSVRQIEWRAGANAN